MIKKEIDKIFSTNEFGIPKTEQELKFYSYLTIAEDGICKINILINKKKFSRIHIDQIKNIGFLLDVMMESIVHSLLINNCSMRIQLKIRKLVARFNRCVDRVENILKKEEVNHKIEDIRISTS